jgi:hypothetical protein
MGSKIQTISVCEDLPLNSQIVKLTVFDSSLSAKPVCFYVNQNQFFTLEAGNNNTNGWVVLTKELKYPRDTSAATHSFIAFAYFCDRPHQNITQTIIVRTLQVNQHAPKIQIPVSLIE